MRTSRINLMLIVAMLGWGGLAAIGCEADVHDNTADVHDNPVEADTDVDVDIDADFDFDADDDEVEAGDSVMVTMNAGGVVLVDPDEQPSEQDRARAAYFKIFLDDADSEPIVVTASASVSVKIPENTKEGDHKLLCRLFKHDGSAIGETHEVSIKVKASASVSGGTAGAGGTDMM